MFGEQGLAFGRRANALDHLDGGGVRRVDFLRQPDKGGKAHDHDQRGEDRRAVRERKLGRGITHGAVASWWVSDSTMRGSRIGMIFVLAKLRRYAHTQIPPTPTTEVRTQSRLMEMKFTGSSWCL